MNLLKNGIREVAASSDLKTNLVNTAIGLTAGVVAKKLYTGKSKNPITIMLGTLLEVGVTNFISKNADGIKNVGGYVLKKMLSHTADSKKA